MKSQFGFSPSECRILSRLNSPIKIQDFVDGLMYGIGDDEVRHFSPRRVLETKSADCFDGAIFGAAALRFHGYRPLISSISSVRDHDHVVALFKANGCWGAVSKSKYTGLGYREPIHRTLRELFISYFEQYFNFQGEKTARGYCLPVDLSRFDNRDWMTSDKPVSFIEDYLNEVSYKPILTGRMERGLRKVTPIDLEAGELWIRKNGLRDRAKNYLERPS